MSKNLTYNSFLIMPVKVRKSVVLDCLESQWGYHIDDSHKRKDKAFNKVVATFQKDNGLVPNGVICEKTFDALKIPKKKRN